MDSWEEEIEEIESISEGNDKIIIELYTIEFPITYCPNYFIYNNNLNFEYYHFCFNNRKREIEPKRDYYKENENVKKIKIVIDYEVKSLALLFKECVSIKSINFIQFNRKMLIVF